ncbi:MAG TPA: flagellar hook capping protein [Firmicutes bacterium]|nr:flagellar hook capping protein [Bacillota bacterium]
MSTNAINAYTNNISTTSTYSGNQVSNTESQFSSDTFLKLLSAQLQYQDPTQPMDNTQMILQMAQFSTIEQLNNLNTQFSYFMEMSTIQSGANMVGKEVTIGLDDEESIKGVVTKVGFTSSGPIVEVDGTYYEMWRVVEISDGSGAVTPPTIDKEEGTDVEGITPEETNPSEEV